MSFYILKPGTHIEADPYETGMEDGFTTWTSNTVIADPIPVELEEVALYWITDAGAPGGDWVCSVPYVGAFEYLFPDDYVITPTSGSKYRMSKTAFEAKYELEGGGL